MGKYTPQSLKVGLRNTLFRENEISQPASNPWLNTALFNKSPSIIYLYERGTPNLPITIMIEYNIAGVPNVQFLSKFFTWFLEVLHTKN